MITDLGGLGASLDRELLQKQLGKGEGVTALIEASSREPDGTLHAPLLDERRLSLAARPEHVRLTTFKITLDVVETLTGYSSKLAKYPKVVLPSSGQFTCGLSSCSVCLFQVNCRPGGPNGLTLVI